MDCPRCGTDNEPGRKFCRECGARLGVACPQCQTVDTAGSKFCGQCGAALGQHAPVDGATAVGGAAEATTERRLVSVLFADLVGFTPLSEGRDPETVRELLSEYYELAREVVGRYKGSIEKFIGDAVMAVWGAPVARENDAERAVRCALDLVQSVQALGARRQLPELTARAGVHTGEAAVSMGAVGQGLVAGDIVNTAARLQSAAEPGSVVVGEPTQRAADRSIAFRRLPDLTLKGKADPVPAWQATHIVGAGGARGPRTDGLEPPFVGRADELRLLRELYHATVREGRTRLVSVIGQAGIGKTRLAWELEKYVTGLADESRWLQGRSPAYQEGLSYWALGEIVRRAAGIAEDEDTASSRQKLAALLAAEVPDDEDRQWLEPRLGALLGTESTPEGERGELFAAWRMLFERLGARAPLVLVVEDVHWADAGMLDFIDSMVQWSRASPILVITLARPELLERRPTWGAGQRSFSSLHLDPLPEAEMAELLKGLVPGLPAQIVQRVIGRAEGVPLYAVETVRMLIDQGVLEATGDGYRVSRPPDQLALPASLHALIAARLDALPADERRLLQDASVLGQTFYRGALRAIADERRGDLDELVDSLVAKELLRIESDPRSPERGQLGFVQAAIREVAYGGLGRSERRSRHLAVANHYASLHDEESVGMVASHFLAAYQAAPDHPQAAAVREQASEFLLAAAERARALHSYDQTLAYLEEALAISDEPVRQAALRERAGEVSRAAENPDAAQRYLLPAIEWHRQRADAASVARLTAVLSTALIDGVRTQQAIELIQQTITEFDVQDEAMTVRLMANLARGYFIRGEWQPALEWADRAIVAGERVDDIASVIEALINRAGAVSGLGRPREAQALLRGAVALADRHGAPVSALRAAANLGAVESEDSPRDALAVLEAGLEQARRAGEIRYVSNCRHQLLEVRSSLGEWSALLDEVAAMDEEALQPHEWEHFNDSLAVIAAFRGEVARAAELLKRWQSDPQKTVTQHEAAHHHALGLVAFAQGRLGEAYEEGRTAATSLAYRHDGFFMAGRAALWLRDSARLADAVAEFEKEGAHTGLRKAQRATLAAGLATLRGEDAETPYRDAIGRWTELENPLELALAQLELATFAGSGEVAEPAEAVARRLLAGLEAEGVVDRLRASEVAVTG